MKNRVKKGIFALLIIGGIVTFFAYRYPSTYGPFAVTIVSPERKLENIVVTLLVTKARGHSTRGVYSHTKMANSGEPIIFPRGYLGHKNREGAPLVGVLITHPLIEFRSFGLKAPGARPSSKRVNLGEIVATLYPVYDEAEIKQKRNAIEPRPVDANRIERDSLPVFKDYRLRQILGNDLMYHFRNVKRTYQRAVDSSLIDEMPSNNKEDVLELIAKTYTTEEYRNYSLNLYNSTLRINQDD